MSNRSKAIRVLVADSSRIATQLLADGLRRDRGLSVIQATAAAGDLVAEATRNVFDVLLISAGLEGDPARGLQVLRELRGVRPEARAIVLLDSRERERVIEAFRAGAKGVFCRSDSMKALFKCIYCVHAGQVWASSEELRFALEALAEAPSPRAAHRISTQLTKREEDVVQAVAEGLSNREIAARLALSEHTVKNYLFRIFEKLGVSNRVEVAFYGITKAPPSKPVPAAENASLAAADVGDVLAEAAQGSGGAQLKLAQMYQGSARSVDDKITSYMWFLLAERTGRTVNRVSRKAKDQLADNMKAAEVAEAERRAAEWLRSRGNAPSGDTDAVSLPAAAQAGARGRR